MISSNVVLFNFKHLAWSLVTYTDADRSSSVNKDISPNIESNVNKY